jgi:hypothetical protein
MNKKYQLMWGGRDNVSIPYMLADRFCFIAGTQILMRNDATKNIEDIDVGDIVKSWNEITNKVEDSKVVKLIQPVHDDMLVIRFSNDVVNENTFDHPYYVKDKGWCSYSPTLTKERYDINSELLEVGDICYFNNSDELEEVEISFIKENWGEVQTYIFELDNNYTFFANGILTHNKCFKDTTQVVLENGKWKNITEVKIGDKLLGKDGESNEVIDYHRPTLGQFNDKLPTPLKMTSINGGGFDVSQDHIFMTSDGWKTPTAEMCKILHSNVLESEGIENIKDLQIGDKIVIPNGLEEVISVEFKEDDSNLQLYNFVLKGNKTYYVIMDGHDKPMLVHNKVESLELTSTVVSGSSLEGSSSVQTHEDMNVGDTVLAASIVGLPDTDVASEFLLWEYTGSDPISSQITLVTASIESIITSSHADFKLIETSGKSEPLKISDTHPVLAQSESIWAFEYVGDIDATYTLVSSSLEEVAINTITQITGSEQTGSFRRFDIEPQDTYFADGILVHN